MFFADAVIKFYGSDCYICGGPINMDASRVVGELDWEYGLHIDHVVPKKLGGTDELHNLRPAHGLCNVKKAETPLIEHLQREHPERLASLVLKEPQDSSLASREPMRLGYIRVNAEFGTSADQTRKLNSAGVEKIFSDVYHGKVSNFPGLQSLLKDAREGDTVVVCSLDRFTTSLKRLVDIISSLRTQKVEIEILDEGLKTTEYEGELFVKTVQALGDFSKKATEEVTQVGLSAARARGKKGGRKSKVSSEQREQIKKLYDAKELTVREIASMFSITPPTVYRAMKDKNG